MTESEGDAIVLSYHDSLLRRSDVSLLESPHWLNDKILGFYFEYLEYDVLKEFGDRVCFITPDVAHFIKLHDGPAVELGVFLDPLNLRRKQLVALAVNDCTSLDAPGGSHWSALVFDRRKSVFLHLDSAGSNSPQARRCCCRMAPYLGIAECSLLFEEVSCPQQENAHDCGVYVLLFVEAVCRALLLNEIGADIEKTSADKRSGGVDIILRALGSVIPERARQWRVETKRLVTHTLANS